MLYLIVDEGSGVVQLHGLPADRRVVCGQGQAAQRVNAHAPVPDPAQDLLPHRGCQRDLGGAHTDMGAALDHALRGTLGSRGGRRSEPRGRASLASTEGSAGGREGGREGTKFGQRERKSFPKSSTQNLALQLSALDGSLRPSTQHQVPRQQDLLCRGSRKTYVSSRDALTPQTPSQSGMRPGLKSLLTKQHLCCLQNA